MSILSGQQESPVFSLTNLPSSLQSTLLPLAKILNLETIQLNHIRPLIAQGLPEQSPLIRQYVWKIVLGYLPKQRRKWQTHVQKQQQLYQSFLTQFFNKQVHQDVSLTISKNHQQWPLFEKDYNLWQQIEKDTSRTHAQLAFFSQPSQQSFTPFFTATRKQKYKLITGDQTLANLTPQEKKKSYNYDHMTRILFIFAKLNPKAVYVQGMNQILAPIFYLVNAHHSKRPIQEAACFFMFNNVMSDLVDIHITDFGNKIQNPIHSRIRGISTMLLALQPKIWQKLDQLKIDPFFYSFRWITLLFSQQFQMYQTLKIWQNIFSHNDRSAHTNFIALSLLLSSSSKILSGEYGQVMHHLKFIGQSTNIDKIIKQANQLHCQHKYTDFCTMANQSRNKLQQKKKNKLRNFFRNLF